MFCTRCGTPNADEANFCRNCSTPLPKAAQPPRQTGAYGSVTEPSTVRFPNAQPAQPPMPAPAPPQPPYPGYQGYDVMQNSGPNFSYAPNASASGRAITAMVLGILAFVSCGPLTGIPAIIVGKAEMNAIKQGQAPPAGMTIAKIGFYTGIVSTVLFALGLAFVFLAVLFGSMN